jgi:hypothetical protein
MGRPIGFSTGAIARGDFQQALAIIGELGVNAVELSALREIELLPLIGALDTLDLQKFKYISFHAPSRLDLMSEEQLVDYLQIVAAKQIPLIVHPDVIKSPPLWESLGEFLCLENMDKRKPIGRSVRELDVFFALFPAATFCLDIGHAHQCDPSMFECFAMIEAFHNRLRQIHLSQVNTNSRHETVSYSALIAFQKVIPFLPNHTPVILEAMVADAPEEIHLQTKIAERLFAVAH